MPIVPSLQIEFVREVLATLAVVEADPATVEDIGGTVLELGGLFQKEVPCLVEVLIDGTPHACYSHDAGRGNNPVPLGDNTLICATPPLPRGGPYDVRVTQDVNVETLASAISVVHRFYRDQTYKLRKVLPPKWLKGARTLRDEPTVEELVLMGIPTIFQSASLGTLSFTPTVYNPDGVSLTWTSVGTALPGWCTLDPVTGKLAGNPGVLDIGTTSGVQLRATGGGDDYDTNTFDITVVS